MASGGLGLVTNLAVRQCLLKFLYAFVGDLGTVKVQPLKPLDLLDFHFGANR